MLELVRNIVAIIRGNVLCFVFGIKHNVLIRFFPGIQITKESQGEILMEKGVMIGRNTIITVRNGAQLYMGKKSSLNADCKVICQKKICIGENTIFGPNVLIYDHDHVYDADGVKRNEFECDNVVIGNNCWIGAGTIILKGTNIGNNCVIAAGSVVKGRIPSGQLLVQKRHGTLFDLNRSESRI
ncbi:Bacterial transferase hexapeptide (three repeats) [Coprococcus catus GD/7]|uniref:Bacterial transferase hexapeptide (Three repeats) n=1 Tax=Coprococcus catus GD/7 TaxID=717962 RepID=D4J4U0_9FIRM|nr:acyltransferase [Coprococcus catus]CBK79361.1 Bacterial transferase hexapeptide (three repeats) [Coprococcus catus GD/7]